MSSEAEILNRSSCIPPPLLYAQRRPWSPTVARPPCIASVAPGRVSRVRISVVGIVGASSGLSATDRMARAGIADGGFSHGDTMPALVGARTLIHSMRIVDAATNGIPFHELKAHDELEEW